MLITSSKDYYIKIWSVKGELKASLNLNHPLPMLWELSFKKMSNIMKKALYALKILDIISQRHKDIFDFGKDKSININKFL